jgi:hypothetical protein
VNELWLLVGVLAALALFVLGVILIGGIINWLLRWGCGLLAGGGMCA